MSAPALAASPGAKIRFNIPAGAFEDTIFQFSQQAHILFSYAGTDSLQGTRTNSVVGEFDAREALDLLLNGTSLVADWDGDEWFGVRRSGPGESIGDYNIGAGKAPLTLAEFGRQSGLQILFDYNSLRSHETNPVAGSLRANEALSRMLRATGLSFDFVNDRTITVTPMTAGTQAGESATVARPSSKLPDCGKPCSPALEQVLITKQRDPFAIDPPPGSPLIEWTMHDIERSGFTTLQDVFSTVPQAVGRTPSDHTSLGLEASTNSTLGTGVSLRGLGAGGTLVLLDGQRLAGSGTAALFTDISNFPLTALGRIQIVPDGASLQYGADAVGGVVNIITRKDVQGAETYARLGSVTEGASRQRQYSQLFGGSWGGGSASVAIEYTDQDALAARDRGQATSDLRPWGGDNFDSLYGFPGTLIAGGKTWAIPQLQPGQRPAAAELAPNTQNSYDQWGGGADVLPAVKHVSLIAHGHQPIADDIDIWANAWFSRLLRSKVLHQDSGTLINIPATNPDYINPAGSTDPVGLLYGFSSALGPRTLTVGVNAGNIAMGTQAKVASWTLSATINYGLERMHQSTYNAVNFSALNAALADKDPQTAFKPFGGTVPATLSGIRAVLGYESLSQLETLEVTATRSMAAPAGDAVVIMGSEYRHQSLAQTYRDPNSSSLVPGAVASGMGSAFMEVRASMFSPQNRRLLLEKLQWSAGVRYENYGLVAEWIPKVALLWSPLRLLTFRSTWGHALRMPTPSEQSEVLNSSGVYRLPDATAPGGSTHALVWAGNNAELEAERARTWTFGVDVQGPGDSLVSLTYFNILSSHRLEQPILTMQVLDDPTFTGVIIRNPTFAQQAQICQRSRFNGLASDCLAASVSAIVDGRLQSLETLNTTGLDLSARHAFSTRSGRFEAGLEGTHVFAYKLRGNNAPDLELLNTPHYPIGLRVRGSLSWNWRALEAATFLNFTNRYKDTLSHPPRPVASWTTIDASVSYRLKDRMQGWISVQNLADHGAPFLNSADGGGYDPENSSLGGRVVTLSLRWAW